MRTRSHPQVDSIGPVTCFIDDGKVAAVGRASSLPRAASEVIDARPRQVPGARPVDMHVHFRDPGFEYKETIETGARAATHGGFDDVATMPITPTRR